MSDNNGTAAVQKSIDIELQSQGMDVINISLDDIKYDKSKFKKELGLVDYLSESISQIGLLNPICVVRSDDGKYSLVSGLQRLEAYRKLATLGKNEFAKIPSHVLTFDEILNNGSQGKTLTRLEENLVRKHFLVYDICDHLGQCKEIYLSIHPETAQGGSGQNLKMRPSAYIDVASEFLGKSRATAGRYLQVHKDFIKQYPDAAKTLRDTGIINDNEGHPILNSLSQLLLLSQYGGDTSKLIEVLSKKENNEYLTLSEAKNRVKNKTKANRKTKPKSIVSGNDFKQISSSVKSIYIDSKLNDRFDEPKVEQREKSVVITFKLKRNIK